MLLVPTYISPTGNMGIGLFSTNRIEVGTVYWIRHVQFDRVFTPSEFALLPILTRRFVEHYGFLETSGDWYLCSDNAKYSNHNDDPNSKNNFDTNGIVIQSIASRLILPNEEILCDYREVCLTCKDGPNFI